MVRLFIAVDPELEVRQRIERAAASLHPISPRSKWIDPAGFHLTLVFLGEQPVEKLPQIEAAMGQVAAATAPFSLRFGQGGAFGSPRHPRTIWVGVHGEIEKLRALHHATEHALVPLGFTPETRVFTPHLSLARSRESKGDPALAACLPKIDEDFGETRITGMVLYRSDMGPVRSTYTALVTAPFEGAR
ncbi:MAG: RNA 2',3'-cyclic phosphodiesterase [Byssovorax sp.]